MEYLVIELTEEQLNIIKKYRDECIEKLKDPDLDSWEYIYYEGEIMECNLMLDKKKAHLDTRHLED